MEDLTLQLQEQINALEQNCATKSELESVDQKRTENTIAIDSIVEDLQSQNVLTEEDISHLATQEALDVVQGLVSDNQISLENVQSQIDVQNASISSLQFQTDSNANSINSLQSQIDSLNNSILSIQFHSFLT